MWVTVIFLFPTIDIYEFHLPLVAVIHLIVLVAIGHAQFIRGLVYFSTSTASTWHLVGMSNIGESHVSMLLLGKYKAVMTQGCVQVA